jgi:hypothetical protein
MGVRGGYRFGRWLSAEGEFEWVHHDIDVSGGGVSFDVTGNTYAFTAGARLHIVRWANGEFFASSGVGLLNDGGDETAFAARFGGGVDVHMTRNLGVSVGATYVLPTGKLDKLDYVGGQIGIFYRF